MINLSEFLSIKQHKMIILLSETVNLLSEKLNSTQNDEFIVWCCFGNKKITQSDKFIYKCCFYCNTIIKIIYRFWTNNNSKSCFFPYEIINILE